MTRKDYVLIAGVFNKKIQFMQHESEDVTDEIISIAGDLADALQGDSHAFDKSSFMDAVVKGTKHE